MFILGFRNRSFTFAAGVFAEIRAGAFSVWAGGKEQALAIDDEATGDRAEKTDPETTRPLYSMPGRGEGIKTMEAKELIRRYSAGERDFAGSDLRGARPHEADLEGANLSGANVTSEQLRKAASLKGAATPDGTKHK